MNTQLRTITAASCLSAALLAATPALAQASELTVVNPSQGPSVARVINQTNPTPAPLNLPVAPAPWVNLDDGRTDLPVPPSTRQQGTSTGTASQAPTAAQREKLNRAAVNDGRVDGTATGGVNGTAQGAAVGAVIGGGVGAVTGATLGFAGGAAGGTGLGMLLGCAIGAPAAGIGCIPGAIIGGTIGGLLGVGVGTVVGTAAGTAVGAGVGSLAGGAIGGAIGQQNGGNVGASTADSQSKLAQAREDALR